LACALYGTCTYVSSRPVAYISPSLMLVNEAEIRSPRETPRFISVGLYECQLMKAGGAGGKCSVRHP
jgi:hypothetical protein